MKPLLNKTVSNKKAPSISHLGFFGGIFLFFLLLTGNSWQHFTYNLIQKQMSFSGSFNQTSIQLPGEQLSTTETTRERNGTLLASFDSPLVDTPPWVAKQYVVEENDTIGSISWKMDMDALSIIQLNGLTSPEDLYPGKLLDIPPFSGSVITVNRWESHGELAERLQLSMDQCILLDERKAYVSLTSNNSSYWDHCFMSPVDGRIITDYGLTENPLTRVESFHDGVDFQGNAGSSVRAVERGRVVKLGVHHFYGKYMILSHPKGYQSFYGHLESFTLNQGDSVEKGESIAIMGNSGQVITPQLHFSLFLNEETVDPMEYLY